jgi:molybdenum cofactor cytidylyltransferase
MLLVDQPHIPHALISALVEAHAENFAPIVAPLVDQRRGNPVLFDRAAFDHLVKIEGDIGGRAIFSHFRVLYVPWIDPRTGLDVDTEEDYQRLLDAWRTD